jgi:hypothetical protein
VWQIEVTDQFREWYEELDAESHARMMAAVERLEAVGPSLGRPLVDQITTSRVKNMKELRPLGTSLRVLFVFDPRRTAILLLGGDKAESGWNEWYAGAIVEAERLYDEHIEELRKEGEIE